MKKVPVERIIQVDYETGDEVGRYVTVKQAAEDNFISIGRLYSALNKSNGYLHKEQLRFIYPKFYGEFTNQAIRLRALEISQADLESTICEIARQLTYEFNKNVQTSTVTMWITEKQRELIGYTDRKLTTKDIQDTFAFLNRINMYKKVIKKGMIATYKTLEQISGQPSEVLKKEVVIDVCNNFFRTKNGCIMYSDIVMLKEGVKNG